MKRQLLPIVPFLLVLSSTCLAPAVVADIAYTESYGQLFAIDPDTGLESAIGPTGADAFFVLAFGPEGQLFGICRSFAALDGLYELDLTTGGATRIGDLGVEGLQGLAADALGQLWAHQGDALYSIDPAIGQATQVITLERPVHSLAARGGHLYAATNTAESLFIDRIDTGTGLLEPVLEAEPLLGGLTDASFDARGDLRLLTQGGGILTVIPHGFYRVDLDIGMVEETYYEAYFFGDPVANMKGLALRGGISTVSIPTLGSLGATLLASLLAIAGAFVLKRRGVW